MKNEKRQVLPRGLWVVATPIGNLEDLSPRARQALAEADVILCEDTRRTSTLLSALGLSKSMERLDAHATDVKVKKCVERMQAGESFALVSDAGTPAVSDPGAALVREALLAGVNVSPLPGPSALTALLSVSGFGETAFTFRGFFPRKETEREQEFELVRNASANGVSQIFAWFESPERIVEVLSFFEKNSEETHAIVGKELSKIHEKLFSGTIGEVAAAVRQEISDERARGEWCFAIRLAAQLEKTDMRGDSSDWVKALHCLIDAQVPASEAAKRVSQYFGIDRKEAYEKILKLSGKKVSGGG